MSMDDELFDVADNDAEIEEDADNYDMDVDDRGENDDDDDNIDNDDMENDEEDENEDDEDNMDEDDNDDDNEDGEDGEDDGGDDDDNETGDINREAVDDSQDEDDEEGKENIESETQESNTPLSATNGHSVKKNSNGMSSNGSASNGSRALEMNKDELHGSKASNGTSVGAPTKPDREVLRKNAIIGLQTADELDVLPLVAVPYVQQCQAVAICDGPKWLLTGGEDGFIRKYDFIASIEGKAPLTVAQRHNLIDSITKAGVIGSYWENEQPMKKSEMIAANPKFKDSDFTTGSVSYEPKVSPVYALEVERNGLWCLSGLQSGGISLYTMIYNEGGLQHYFAHSTNKLSGALDKSKGHSDAVSVLRLNYQQNAFLSGSWDKTIREWDLNTGKIVNVYRGSSGQISSLQYRPRGLEDLTFQGSSSDVDSLFGSDEEEDNDVNASRVSKSESTSRTATDDNIFMSSGIDGTINIWDARVSGSSSVLKLAVPEGTPPWCMNAAWSNDGDKIYAGRRNNSVDEISLRKPHISKSGSTMVPNVLKKLLFPKGSGPVTALAVVPNDKFIFCGSSDNIRLYDLSLHPEELTTGVLQKKRATPFQIIPGHHGGSISSLVVDETGRFMIAASGNRGWGHQPHAENVLVFSIDY